MSLQIKKRLMAQNEADTTLTRRIIQALHDEVVQRGGQLVIISSPSKAELSQNKQYTLYKKKNQMLASVCKELSIDCLDMAPPFKNALLRTHFREGIHWNKNGHKVMGNKIIEYLAGKNIL